MRLSDLVKAATSRVETVRVVNTAMNPLLWLVGLVTPLSLVLATVAGQSWLGPAMFAFRRDAAIASPDRLLRSLLRDPDRLQSEEYRIRQRELVIYEKGANAEIVDPARDRPQVEQLPRGFVDGGEP